MFTGYFAKLKEYKQAGLSDLLFYMPLNKYIGEIK